MGVSEVEYAYRPVQLDPHRDQFTGVLGGVLPIELFLSQLQEFFSGGQLRREWVTLEFGCRYARILQCTVEASFIGADRQLQQAGGSRLVPTTRVVGVEGFDFLLLGERVAHQSTGDKKDAPCVLSRST